MMTSESNQKAEKLIGVEVSDSVFKAVCLDENKTLSDAFNGSIDRGQKTLPQLIDFVNETKVRFGSFVRIGIAVPGLVSERTKRVAFSTFNPEHEEIDFLSEIEAATNLKITVENDANAAAYGEYLLGAGRGSRDLFYVTLGTGIGGALIFGGKIWRGAAGFAGEFGHTAINSEGMKLEDVASAANIVRRTRSRFHQDHTSSLSQLREEKITIEDVIQAARNEDDLAKMMLQRTGTFIGTALAGVINLLNIEKIVIGGEVMQSTPLVLEAIIKRAKQLSFPPSFESTRILGGELDGNAAAVGAAVLANGN
jgi:glucokinase